MKKLLVTASDNMESSVTDNIQEFLSLQVAYGLYDFDLERLIEDVCRQFKLKVIGITHPETYLSDDAGGTVTITFKEEYLGY